MAHILIMPRQGNTVESCIITDWKVKENDTVTAETIVCEVETDKAVFEIPAGADGTVLKLLYAGGDDVPVLSPVAVIGAPGEDWRLALGETKADESHDKENHGFQTSTEKKIPALADSYDFQTTVEKAVSPRAKNLAEKEALPLDTVSGTGPGGRIIERDIAAALGNRPHLTAAAKAAGAKAIPIEGSGLGGRITVSDLSSVQQSPLLIPDFGEGVITETPIRGIRKIIAGRMLSSLTESAQFTLNSSAPAARLQEIRSSIKTVSAFTKDAGLSKITINDLLLFAVSRTLPQFPFMNAQKSGDTIKTFERVHLATAVDTPRGLMVPVIRNANLLSLMQISAQAKKLAEACQNNTIKSDELSGSTFTVTNLGSLGITSFTPVLNAPEVAILGVGCIEMKPASFTGNEKRGCCSCEIRMEPHINFSLTINHQVIDGAPAAHFLKELGEAVANIDRLLEKG